MTELFISDYLDSFKDCLQYEKPYCQAECPFHIDINDFVDKIKKGSYNSAYKIYRNAVGFPRIVASICSQPCRGVCPVKDYGGAIELKNLENAVIDHATRKDPTSYNIPVRPGKVAIIGSGLAGLGALLRMATKKYETHVFEKSEKIGGKLNDNNDTQLFLQDIHDQLHHEKYEVHLNTEIVSREQINSMGFDVVFVATGKDGEDFGLTQAVTENQHKHALLDGETAWFAGGALIGDENIFALSGGLYMGLILEAYLKTGNLNYEPNEMKTNTIVDAAKISKKQKVESASKVYSKEETLEEASRCLQCKCDFCKTYEDLTAYYDKYPLRIKDEVFATTLDGSSEVKATPAKRLMSTSNLTGIVKEVCPKNIDLDGLILAGRQRMHKLEKAPWAFHDFWVRDMDFSNSEASSIIKNAQSEGDTKTKKCDYAFFPGCQLGASLPEIVDRTYEYLLGKDSSTAMMLRCCGAPARWSGDNDKHEQTLSQFKTQWEELGSPVLITACPTCTSQITSHLPEIQTISIYEYIDINEPHISTLLDENVTDRQMDYAVFDPCTTRENIKVKEAVRSLAERIGINNTELPDQSDIPRCCSFGGQPEIANPGFANYVTEKRINESPLPYITYCINCRDSFVKADKETKHILELLFGTEEKPVPTVSERRDNRINLKRMMLNKYWSEDMEDIEIKYDFRLVFPPEVLTEMDKDKILTDEVYETLEYILRTNRKVVDDDTGVHSGYKQIGFMTYWVSYKETPEENVYKIVDAYCHRMEIELEAVWNGVKTEIDV